MFYYFLFVKHIGYGGPEPKIVCQTWFESECNTTFVSTGKGEIDRPNTWCKKVPKKICAPDNCKMVPGKEQCNEKMLVSTIQSPSEICDLQPQKHCRLITRLTPHLVTKQVCRKVPKEVCHMALTKPHSIKKPMTMKWCTKDIKRAQEAQRLVINIRLYVLSKKKCANCTTNILLKNLLD